MKLKKQTLKESLNIPDQLPVHPLVALFPLQEDKDFNDLIEDIRLNGLYESVKVHKGYIVEGKRRYLASYHAGITPTFVEVTPDDVAAYIRSRYKHGKKYSISQAALIAAKMSNIEYAGNYVCSQVEAMKTMKVKPRIVKMAAYILKTCAKELICKIETNHITVNMAHEISRFSHEKQIELAIMPKKKAQDFLKRQRLAGMEEGEEVQICTIKIEVSDKILKLMDAAQKRKGLPDNRNDLIEAAILNFCENNYPSEAIKQAMKKMPFQMKTYYSDKEQKVVNGISKQEKDAERFEEENGLPHDSTF